MGEPATSRKESAAVSVIVAGAVYDRQTIVRFVGGRKTWAALQRAGLAFTKLGRRVFVRGQAVLDTFARLEAEQQADGGKEARSDA